MEWDAASRSVIIAGDIPDDIDDDGVTDIADLEGKSFLFTSGVGGWETDFWFNDDGSFSGVHSDADADREIRSYFNGFFRLDGQNPDVSYNLFLTDLWFDELGVDHEYFELEDGSQHRVDYVEMAYGFEDSSHFILYPPDYPIALLQEDFKGWTGLMDAEREGVLGKYGIYNTDQGYGMLQR